MNNIVEKYFFLISQGKAVIAYRRGGQIYKL